MSVLGGGIVRDDRYLRIDRHCSGDKKVVEGGRRGMCVCVCEVTVTNSETCECYFFVTTGYV